MKDNELYNDYLDGFAERLTDLRMKKGVSAREMSLSLGLTPSYIGKIEGKHTFPSMFGFYLICEYLGITPKDFFDESMDSPEALNRIVTNLKLLDEKKLNDLNAVVEGLVGGVK